MDIMYQGLITLLKSAVIGEGYRLPEGFSMEDACEIIQKQGLAALAYEGAIRCGISRKSPAMDALFRDYYKVLLQSERQMAKVDQLYQAFETAEIDYLPFKGCVMKALYPKPELRAMGDADILIRMEQYEKIKPILNSLGFEMKLESDCELVWTSPELYLELHICLVQPSQVDFYDYFGDGWGRAVRMEGCRYGFSPEDMYVHLFMHFAKHYRSGGIGCRHVVDLWVFRRKNPAMDQNYVSRELEKLHLRLFHDHCIRLLDAWFGEGQWDSVTEFISRRIFSGGSWGNQKDYQVFQELSKSKRPDSIRHSRIHYTIHLMFPPLSLMQKKYSLLKRMPFLLPAAWIVRGVTILLREREKVDSAVKKGRMIDDDALHTHQEALRMVGLAWQGQAYRED